MDRKKLSQKQKNGLNELSICGLGIFCGDLRRFSAWQKSSATHNCEGLRKSFAIYPFSFSQMQTAVDFSETEPRNQACNLKEHRFYIDPGTKDNFFRFCGQKTGFGYKIGVSFSSALYFISFSNTSVTVNLRIKNRVYET